jgi:hypothetical protein
MSLDGRIEDFSLADVFQLITMGSRTGLLRVAFDGRIAVVAFENGEAVSAALNKLSGENAVYEMFNWNEGEFTFDPAGNIPEHNISMDTQNLIMESVRQLDEWVKFGEVIPDTAYVPALASDSRERTENLTLQASEWKVLSMTDGRNSVSDISRKVGFSEFETTQIIYNLVNKGLLEILPPPPTSETDEKNQKKSLRDLFIASSGQSGRAAAEKIPELVGSNVAVFAIFVNSLLDNFDKPNGLYNAIEQEKTLRKRISELSELYPEFGILKVTDDDRIDVIDLDTKVNTLDDAGIKNLITALDTIKEHIYETAVSQSNGIAAGRRHDKVMLTVFSGDREPGKIGLADIIRQKT